MLPSRSLQLCQVAITRLISQLQMSNVNEYADCLLLPVGHCRHAAQGHTNLMTRLPVKPHHGPPARPLGTLGHYARTVQHTSQIQRCHRAGKQLCRKGPGSGGQQAELESATSPHSKGSQQLPKLHKLL